MSLAFAGRGAALVAEIEAAGGAGFEWTVLQPDGDPAYHGVSDASFFNSMTSDETGSTLSQNNKSANEDDLSNLKAWDQGDLESAVPGYVNDGTMGVLVRITVATTPPDNVQWWMGVGFVDEAGDFSETAADGVGCVYMRNATADWFGAMDSSALVGDDQAGPYLGVYTPGGAYPASGGGSADVGGIVARPVAGGHGRPAFDVGTMNDPLHCLVIAGCDNGTDSGPHVGKLKLEVKPFLLT